HARAPRARAENRCRQKRPRWRRRQAPASGRSARSAPRRSRPANSTGCRRRRKRWRRTWRQNNRRLRRRGAQHAAAGSANMGRTEREPQMRASLVLAAASFIAAATAAHAADMKILTAGAMKAVVLELVPAFEKETGHK